MVKDGELVVIDFQDALQGPRQYDLVALLRDSYVELEPAVRGDDARPLRSRPSRGDAGAKLDRRAFKPLLRPAHRPAQAEGRRPLRVHQPGEGQPGLPAVHPGLARATSARRSSAARTTRTSSRCGRSSRATSPSCADGGRPRALVLCAGLGTRLRPLTERWPKPAMPLLGLPLLRYTFAVLTRRRRATAVGINTHHLPEVMERVARRGARAAGPRVDVGARAGHPGHRRRHPRAARRSSDDDVFIVCNGDILFALGPAPVLAAHRTSGAAATMVLLPDACRREVRRGGDRRGRPGAPHRPATARAAAGCTAWHFTGVHVLSPRVFEAMAPEGPEDINHDVYPRLFGEGGVRGVVVDAPWSDLGSPATYLETQSDLLLGRVPDPLGPESPLAGRGGTGPLVEPGARVHPTATLAPDVFVAAGVEVPAGAHVRRTALLPGAVVGPRETVDGEIRWSGQALGSG